MKNLLVLIKSIIESICPRVATRALFILMTMAILSEGCWAAGTSGTLSFSASDSDLDGSQISIARTVGGQTFVISAPSLGYLGYDGFGLYSYDGVSASGVNVTIAAPTGYMFDVDSFKALASDNNVSYVLTYADGSTSPGSLSSVSSSSLSTLSPTISGVKQIVVSSADYAVFQGFVLSNIRTLPYSVTYNGNGNTGGSVPTDSTAYSSGGTVTVLGNTGSLTRTGYTFNRWDTIPGGGGSHYVGGNTFPISSNTTLYAQWTANPPSATTGSATALTVTGATLGGTVNDNGLTTTVTFDYGLSTSYSSNAAATTGGTISAGTGSTPVVLSLSGLSCNTPYHFRVKAVNVGGTTYGSDGSFTTTACVPGAPTIGTATAGAGQASVTFSAPGSDGGAAISGYTVTSSPGGKTGTGTTSPILVTGLTNGTAYTFTVTATNSLGTGPSSASSNSVTPMVTQAITFTSPGAQNFGTTPTLSATSDSGLAVSFTSSTTGVCTITSGGALNFLTTGTCTINADQAGNSSYAAAATVTRSFTVVAVVPGAPSMGTATAGAGQATVTFSAPTSNGGATITGYTVTSSPGSFYSTGTAGPITVTGLTNGTAYTFTVTATNGIGTGSASTASNSVTPKANQTISFAQPASQSFGITPTLSATSDSGLTVTFTSSTTGVCTITTGGALTFLTTGACTIDADQIGNGTYFAATTVSRTFSVGSVVPGAPTIGTATAGDTQASVAFTAPSFTGGSSITGYTVMSNPGSFTGTGATSPITVPGLSNGTAYTFTVTATNSTGTSSASAASNSVTPRAVQTITFTNPSAKNFGTTPTLSATASSSLTVSFSSSTTGVCTITSGGVLAFLTTGTCTIDAAQAGNGTYLPATPVTRSFSVNAVVPGAPTIGTATAGITQAAVAFTAPTFTGGASITSYTVTSNPGGLSGAGSSSPITVTGLSNGTGYTFTVTATNSAGTGAASAASSAVTPKAAQTITFTNPGAQSFGTTPTLSATATSGLAVTFTSTTTGVCTITSGGTLAFVTTGNCTINADQAGNASYAAATTVSQTFAVGAVVPGAPSIGTASAGNTQATVSFTAPSNTGGGTITSYTVTSSPEGKTATGATSPITVTGLTNGTAYTFTVTATNSAGTGAASAASNSVTPALAKPVANAASATVAFGSGAYVITPTLGGGTAISLAVATQPAHGTASVSGLTLIYTPVANYSGTDTFTYTGTNAGGTSAPALVTVTVNPPAPVAGAVSMKVEVGSSNNVVPLALTGGVAASVAVGSAPIHGTATASGKVIAYTPAAGYSGNDSFTYTATNAGGTSAAATVSVLVQSRPDPTKDAEVIGLLNAQIQTANRFGQTQIGNFQTHLESLHARSQTLLQEGPNRSSRGGIARTPVESTATSLTEFSSGANTATGRGTSALFSPRASGFTPAARCQAWDMDNCTATGAMRPASDGMDSVITGTLTSANTRTDWWPWPTLSVNGSSKDLLGSGMDVWSAGTVNVGRQSENDSRFTTSGISLGGDDHVTDKLILGVGAGFGHERQKIGSNDTKNRGDSYSIVAYGSYQPEEGFFIDGLIGYGHLAFDAERYVTATGDFAQSDRKGSQWFSSLSGGYEYVDGKFLFSPYGRLDLIHTRLDETAESGAGTSNLTYQAQTSRSTKLSLGLRSETAFEIDKGTIKPSLRVEYQHDFAEPGVANMVYSDDANGTVYQLDMENTDRNTMVLGLGLDFALRKSWQTGLSYKFSHGSSSSSQMQSFGVYVKRAF